MPTCLTRLESESCRFHIERRAPTTVLMRIEGHDVGEFGALPMRCLQALMPAKGRVALFIDARGARGASMDVSNDWAAWLGRERARFAAIHMITGSRYVLFTADFVRKFSELESLMHVHRDATAFDEALAATSAGH